MIAPICFSTFIRYHISADHRSLPAAHHEEVCKVSSSNGSSHSQYITSSFLNHPCDEDYFYGFRPYFKYSSALLQISASTFSAASLFSALTEI